MKYQVTMSEDQGCTSEFLLRARSISQFFRVLCSVSASVVLLLAGSWAEGSVIGISSTVTDPALGRGTGPNGKLVSFSAGGETYSGFDMLTATSVSGSSSYARSGNTPPASLTSLSDAYLTTGTINVSTLDYNIGRTLNAGKAPLFFMYEFGPAGNPMDDVVVTPLSDGNPIPGWSLTISSSDYGTKTATWDSTIIGFVASAGATFSLADFTGGTGSLQAVNGLRFTDSSGAWDPSMVGMIPEPASLGLLVLGWGVACWRRSRRKSN